MTTLQHRPARDPEKLPSPKFEEPDYDDPIVDPATGELPEEDEDEDEEEDDEEEDEDEDIPDREPLRA